MVTQQKSEIVVEFLNTDTGFVVVTLLVTIMVLVLLNFLLGRIFNIIALSRADTPRTTGMIFNTKTKKLEGDSSKITPFQ